MVDITPNSILFLTAISFVVSHFRILAVCLSTCKVLVNNIGFSILCWVDCCGFVILVE